MDALLLLQISQSLCSLSHESILLFHRHRLPILLQIGAHCSSLAAFHHNHKGMFVYRNSENFDHVSMVILAHHSCFLQELVACFSTSLSLHRLNSHLLASFLRDVFSEVDISESSLTEFLDDEYSIVVDSPWRSFNRLLQFGLGCDRERSLRCFVKVDEVGHACLLVGSIDEVRFTCIRIDHKVLHFLSISLNGDTEHNDS
ncbi:hypothetical protein PMAYCL1PPCAC_23263 [Pristionchus mayeri]|uniref:Uncharacterized protein n=1 Tax=Pristionchus mayeri TaxID=1317129 RepID=A0AAN5I5I8_9BILA|nr:hypothetical protein PMAYCL1PPCAC_23263 [Pristionchus mayeri]